MFLRDLWQAVESWTVGPGVVQFSRIALGGLVVYLVALAIVRLGNKRSFGRNSVFDLLLALILGGVLGRAINGGAALAPTAAAALVLVGVHWLFGSLAMRSDAFGSVVKGREHQIVVHGEMLGGQMKQHSLKPRDVEEAARLAGMRIDDVESAYFERNGKVSLQRRPRQFEGTLMLDGREHKIHLVEMRTK